MEGYLYKILNPVKFLKRDLTDEKWWNEPITICETYDKREALSMFKKYWGGEQPYYRVTSPWIKTVYPECLIGDSSLEAVLEPDECWHWSASSQRGRYS